MVAKLTLTLPPPLLAGLRERAEREGRSLNEVAVRTLEQGLDGVAAGDGWVGLDALVETPPSARYDPEEMARLRAGLGPLADTREDVDWARGA